MWLPSMQYLQYSAMVDVCSVGCVCVCVCICVISLMVHQCSPYLFLVYPAIISKVSVAPFNHASVWTLRDYHVYTYVCGVTDD